MIKHNKIRIVISLGLLVGEHVDCFDVDSMLKLAYYGFAVVELDRSLAVG
jgi:hypothetical protein